MVWPTVGSRMAKEQNRTEHVEYREDGGRRSWSVYSLGEAANSRAADICNAVGLQYHVEFVNH